jgi:hypothetical protein
MHPDLSIFNKTSLFHLSVRASLTESDAKTPAVNQSKRLAIFGLARMKLPIFPEKKPIREKMITAWAMNMNPRRSIRPA